MRSTTAAALGAVLALAAPAAAAPDARVRLNNVEEVAARGDAVVTTLAGNRTSLRFGFESAIATLTRRPAITGLDLGAGADGAPVLVYTRCSGRRPPGVCDIYRMDPATRRARKLAVSRRRCDELSPTLSGGVLVFARFRRAARRPRLRCARGVFVKRPGAQAIRIRRDVPADLGLEGDTLAMRLERVSGDYEFTFRQSILTMPLAGGPAAQVATATGFRDRGGYSGTFLHGLALDGGFVHWARETYAEPVEGNGTYELLRAPVGGGPAQTLERDGRVYAQEGYAVRDLDVTGGAIFYTAGDFSNGFLARVDSGATFR